MKWWVPAVLLAWKLELNSKARGDRELWAVTVYFNCPGFIGYISGHRTFISENFIPHYSHKYRNTAEAEELVWKKNSYGLLDLSKTNYVVIVDNAGNTVFDGSVDQLCRELRDLNNNSGH